MKAAAAMLKSDTAFYTAALAEVRSGNRDEGISAKAFALSDGATGAAFEAAYVKLRVADMKRATFVTAAQASVPALKSKLPSLRATVAVLGLVLLVFPFISGMAYFDLLLPGLALIVTSLFLPKRKPVAS